MAKPALCSLYLPASCHRFGGREVTVPCSPLLGPFTTQDPSTSLQVCPGTNPLTSVFGSVPCVLHPLAEAKDNWTVLRPSRFITSAAM